MFLRRGIFLRLNETYEAFFLYCGIIKYMLESRLFILGDLNGESTTGN